MEKLRIGTRGSKLALWQAHEVMRRLDEPTSLVIVKTEGDQKQDIALQGGSTTGFFTKDIERRLITGEIDVAVHSLKDLPTELDPALELAAILPRAPISDLLVVHPDWFIDEGLLPIKQDCRVGAGSLRRQALIRLYAPHTSPELIRGNVPTRLGKCSSGQYGAIVLARAGVERLELRLEPLRAFELNPLYWLPAPGQGAVAVEVRRDDDRARRAISAINHPTTAAAVALERGLLAAFEGGCHTAFGASALEESGRWTVDIGIDRGDAGWGQARFNGTRDEIRSIGPREISKFRAIELESRDELCRPWTPLSS